MFRRLSAPIVVQWEVTSWCNLSCIHCYNHWLRKAGKRSKQVTDREIECWDITVRELIEKKVFAVTVTGGEPLGVISLLLPYLKRLAVAGVQLTLNSNLTLLTKDMTRRLREEIGLTSVLVSLPSSVPSTNAYITGSKNALNQTVKGIEIAQSTGIKPLVNMVVTKANLSEIFPTAQFIRSLGVSSFSATRASVPANCPDFSALKLTLAEFRQLVQELLRVRAELGRQINSLEFYPYCSFESSDSRAFFMSKTCTAAKTTCTIGFDGQLRPCSHSSFQYGDIRKGLLPAWEAMEIWRTDDWIPDQCQPCSLKDRCAGGCKTEAFQYSGNIKQPDPYCDFSQTGFLAYPPKNLPDLAGDRFIVSSLLKGRKEDFGGILYLSLSRWIPVISSLYNLVMSRRGSVLTLSDLSTELNTNNDEARRTTSLLFSKGFIKEVVAKVET